MSGKKHFINPLTRSSEVELHLPVPPTPASQPEEPIKSTATPVKPQYAKEKEKTFESTHQRVTVWIDRELKQQFDELLVKKGGTKTELLNEAVTLLINKHNRKPYTKQASGGE